MKSKLLQKSISALWSFFLSFGLSIATTMCVVTAFDMHIETGLLLRVCALAALVCTLCYSLPLSLVPIGLGAAVLVRMWKTGIFLNALEAFLNRLSRQYDRAYGWGIIRWGYRVAEEMEPELVYILCILGAALALLTALTVCRRTTAIPAVTTSLLILTTCFIVNDTVPDTPWLYLLILCLVVLVMTGYVRNQDEKQGNRLLLYVTPTAALALLILFAVNPREGYDRQDAAKRFADALFDSHSMQTLLGHMDNGSAAGGISDANAIDLKSVGYRMETESQVLQVTAPFTGSLYLRGRAMDFYDGTSWQQSGISYEGLYWPSAQAEPVGQLTITTRFAHRMLYTPYYVDVAGADISTGLLNEESLAEYTFPYLSVTDPVSVSPGAIPVLKDYIPMDSSTARWAQPLADKLRTSQETIYQNAQNIASYVRNSATYNTRTPRMPSDNKDFAQWFLEDSNTGYCVHFATAATVLLQAAGIPARYVTGYYTQVTAGKQITVYSDQAHAWAEYWLPGYGWTVLEATPPDFSEEPQTTAATTEATKPQTTEASNPTQPDATAPTNREPQEESPTLNTDVILWILVGIVAVTAAATVAELKRRIRRMLRQKKLDSASSNEKALLYWRDAALNARLLGETPDKQLYRIAEMAKFSRHTVSEEQLRQFENAAEHSLSRLKQHNPFRRLYYRIILTIW